jgi:uncharacterized membrane protein
VNETDRLEAFSDAVMAVIITIMAFNVKPLAAAPLSAVRASLPEMLAYVLGFAIIGTYWNNHHHLLRATHRISGGVMWSNLHLLFWLSMFPVAGWRSTALSHPIRECRPHIGWRVVVQLSFGDRSKGTWTCSDDVEG